MGSRLPELSCGFHSGEPATDFPSWPSTRLRSAELCQIPLLQQDVV